MNKLFLDIETLPADNGSHSKLEYLFKRQLEKKAKKKDSPEEIEIGGKIADKFEDKFDDYLLKTSFDGAFGRVLCIAYAVNSDATNVICNPDNEAKTLQEFWSIAEKCDLFVGHNIMGFDLTFLYQRSIVLNVKPSKELSFAHYRSAPIYDTMSEWSKWGFQKNVSLEHLALALGFPTPKVGIDGSEVYDFYKRGKVKEICDYCMRDVETTRQVYKRMAFEV